MTMNLQPQQIGCGEDITTNTTILMENKRRGCKRRDCGDTSNTSTLIEKKKRACKRKACSDTNTSFQMEKKKRIDCGDTITSTVAEKKKRACKRKDCGDTNTSTEMEKKKKRKDCGDTNTSTEMEKKKRACKRKDCGDTNTSTEMEKKKRIDCGDIITSTVMEKRIDSCDTITSTIMVKRIVSGGTITPIVLEKKKRAYRRKKFLPHDLILEEILTRLPVTTLLKSVLVSKLWYNSIHNDHKRLTYSHFLQSQKQPQVILSLLNVRKGFEKTGDASYACHFFKFTTGVYPHDNVLRFDKFRGSLAHRDIWELVGHCNGLPCMAQVGNYSTAYTILDPNRQDFLYIFYPARVGKRTLNAHIICHGFGFDPSANEYKLVSVFRTAQKELNFVVFTLGSKSWRNVTLTSTPVSGHAGRPILKIRAPTGTDKSAISCTTSTSSSSRCLVWKMITTLGGAGSDNIEHDNSNEMEMLLSFNLHDEKFQFIQLPAKSTTDEQQKHLLVDYPHLLEFQGFPCIARIEKISGNGSDYPHRCRDDHHGSNSCCCCCIVHLYALKDKVKQVWVKVESIEVRINSTPRWLRQMGSLAPDPCCFCFGSTTTPPTRIFSFSDQMLLYWFNGKYLQAYNLRSKKLQLVLPSNSKEDVIFRAKLKEPQHVFNSSGDDDIYCSNMDYQLHCHEENFLSLETFIPEGVAGLDADVFNELDLKQEDRPCSAFLSIFRGSEVFYPSFN